MAWKLSRLLIFFAAQSFFLNAHCAPPAGPQTFENLLDEKDVAEKEDPSLEKLLQEADRNHDAATTKAGEELDAAIESKFNEATQRGDLNQAKKFQELRERFRASKELPLEEPALRGALSAYQRAISSTRTARIAVYKEVEKKYAQQQCIKRASEVRRKRHQLTQVAPGRYILRNRASGLALGVEGDAKVAGARVIQANAKHGGFFEWTITDLEGGWFSIRNVGSGLSLAVPGASQVKGMGCIQHPFGPDCLDHHWKVEAVDDGFFRITNKSAGFCLGVPGASKEAGKQAIQWPWDPAALDHYWRLEQQ